MIQFLLAPVGPASTDDPDRLLVALSPDDKHETTSDGSDSDQAFLDVRVILIEDLQVVGSASEELLSFLEREPCLRWLARFFASSQATFTCLV